MDNLREYYHAKLTSPDTQRLLRGFLRKRTPRKLRIGTPFQRVWFAAVKGLRNFCGVDPDVSHEESDKVFYGWLWTIAERELFKWLKEKKQNVHAPLELSDWSKKGQTKSAYATVVEKENCELITQTVAELPPPQQQLIKVRSEAKDDATVAETLGKTVSWVRVNAHRMKVKVIEKLEQLNVLALLIISSAFGYLFLSSTAAGQESSMRLRSMGVAGTDDERRKDRDPILHRDHRPKSKGFRREKTEGPPGCFPECMLDDDLLPLYAHRCPHVRRRWNMLACRPCRELLNLTPWTHERVLEHLAA